jgi:hypothetical protein
LDSNANEFEKFRVAINDYRFEIDEDRTDLKEAVRTNSVNQQFKVLQRMVGDYSELCHAYFLYIIELEKKLFGTQITPNWSGAKG